MTFEDVVWILAFLGGVFLLERLIRYALKNMGNWGK